MEIPKYEGARIEHQIQSFPLSVGPCLGSGQELRTGSRRLIITYTQCARPCCYSFSFATCFLVFVFFLDWIVPSQLCKAFIEVSSQGGCEIRLGFIYLVFCLLSTVSLYWCCPVSFERIWYGREPGSVAWTFDLILSHCLFYVLSCTVF